MIKTFLNGVQLPVNPLEELAIKVQGNNQRIEIVALGEITKIGNRKLMTLEIKSLFTDQVYPFCALASARSPEVYVEQISTLMRKKNPARFLCCGDGVDVNLLCSIESFQTVYAAGESNEVYYTLSLMEYREPVIKRVKPARPASKTVVQVSSARVEKKAAVISSHTVKYGDTLWGMAKTYYGNGALYTKIYAANRNLTSNPNHLWVGQVFTIPPLEG